MGALIGYHVSALVKTAACAFLLAASPPLAKRMKWKSRDVESVALSAQEILPADLYARWLAQLPALPNLYLQCVTAVMSSQVAREVIPADIRERIFALWIDAAEKSLSENKTTFAIVPFTKLTRPEGYLAMLREKGYIIEEPQ
jgi:hypothetical protein